MGCSLQRLSLLRLTTERLGTRGISDYGGNQSTNLSCQKCVERSYSRSFPSRSPGLSGRAWRMYRALCLLQYHDSHVSTYFYRSIIRYGAPSLPASGPSSLLTAHLFGAVASTSRHYLWLHPGPHYRQCGSSPFSSNWVVMNDVCKKDPSDDEGNHHQPQNTYRVRTITTLCVSCPTLSSVSETPTSSPQASRRSGLSSIYPQLSSSR